MREQLLGYLVGALEENEVAEIRAALANDADLRAELDELRMQVGLLEADSEPYEPPASLASRTCAMVAEHAERMQPSVNREAATLATSGRWSSADWVVAAGICIAASLLFVTSVANSRFHAQVAGCQNNLRQVGQALALYADSHQGYFPEVPTSGNLAVAGVYAPKLIENGYLNSAQPVFCPAGTNNQARIIPAMATVMEAPADKLLQLQRQLGGSYGYSLGHLENGVYRATRNQNRDLFPVLADAPREHTPQSSTCILGGCSSKSRQCQSHSQNHGCAGQNVLFESGRVKFLSTCQPGENCCDDFFINRNGIVAAGVDATDAVIGGSDVSPLPTAAVSSVIEPVIQAGPQR